MHLIVARDRVTTWTIGPAVWETRPEEPGVAMTAFSVWNQKLSDYAKAEIGSVDEFQRLWDATPDLTGAKQEFNGWRCFAYLPTGEQEQWDPIEDWQQYVPLRGITATLNRLGRDGWTVLSTAEDKRVASLSNGDQSVPLRLRYLLVRDTTASPVPA